MKSIWKFEVKPDGSSAELPAGAIVRTVAAQSDGIFLWAEVDPAAETEKRVFRAYGTGWTIPDDPGVFIGTAFLEALVFHVYEIRP